MKVWIPAAIAIAVTIASAATGVDAGSCSPQTLNNCFNTPATINFSSVPAISQQIVSEEQAPQGQLPALVDPAAPAPYTGPTFGKSLGRQAPTVGYQWSLQ